MAATPKNATLTFVGLQTGKTYAVDAYVSDVDKAFVNLDSGSGSSSTSNTFWIAPENVRLTDFAMITGTADTVSIIPLSDYNIVPGQRFRYTVYLTSLNNRPPINIPFAAGRRISFLQSA